MEQPLPGTLAITVVWGKESSEGSHLVDSVLWAEVHLPLPLTIHWPEPAS